MADPQLRLPKFPQLSKFQTGFSSKHQRTLCHTANWEQQMESQEYVMISFLYKCTFSFNVLFVHFQDFFLKFKRDNIDEFLCNMIENYVILPIEKPPMESHESIFSSGNERTTL